MTASPCSLGPVYRSFHGNPEVGRGRTQSLLACACVETEAARGAPSRVVFRANGRVTAANGRAAGSADCPCHRRRALAATTTGLRRAHVRLVG